MNSAQLYWYYQMIKKDSEKEFEEKMYLTEYGASFTEPKVVKQIWESRKKEKNHNFMDDEDFNKSLEDKAFKSNELVEAIKKIRQNSNPSNSESLSKAGGRDLSSSINLNKLLRDKF